MKLVQSATCLALAVAPAIGVQAQAATILLNNGAPYDYVVHANSAEDGTSLNLNTQPISSLVVYSSSDTIDVGNGNGVAQATALEKKDGFSDITVDPFLNFTIIQFKLEGSKDAADFDILINFVGGATQTISDYVSQSNDKFDIVAGPGELMTSITFSGLRNGDGDALNFDALKQVSFDAVPEPATWAMMIGGFGLIGTAARRRPRAAVRHA